MDKKILLDIFDPDWWIANGRSLLDYPMPSDDMPVKYVAALAENPELAAHLGRWLSKIGQSAPSDAVVGDTLTEEKLRALWEETRHVG